MTTHFDYDIRLKRQRLAELAGQTAELERRLADARLTLERELADPADRPHMVGYPAAGGFEPGSDYSRDAYSPADMYRPAGDYSRAGDYRPADTYSQTGDDNLASDSSAAYASSAPANYSPADGFSPAHDTDPVPAAVPEPAALGEPAPGPAREVYTGDPGEPGSRPEPPFDRAADDRTEVLVQHGRASARRRLSSPQKLVLAGGAGLALLIMLIVILVSGGASWPGSVAVVQRQAVVACRNPDVRSEPSQVNFACAKTSRQILWVFALLTSRDNPRFTDGQSGRVGLEPITPAQGGQLAWSLNLHHPYRPTNPVDSLAVAARAINNIVGGATLTGAGGKPVVQAGLESSAANCLRYTGSAAMTRRPGFPPHCARPVTSAAGQSALVADIYQKWVVGAGPRAAQDAAVLFANAENPGNAEVQTILKRLASAGPLT